MVSPRENRSKTRLLLQSRATQTRGDLVRQSGVDWVPGTPNHSWKTQLVFCKQATKHEIIANMDPNIWEITCEISEI